MVTVLAQLARGGRCALAAGARSLAPRLHPQWRGGAAFASSKAGSQDDYTTSLQIAVHDKKGALAEALDCIRKADVNLTRIQSRPSSVPTWDWDFFVDLSGRINDPNVQSAIAGLRRECPLVLVLQEHHVPWYPRHVSDLDAFASRVLSYGAELDADHPGFTDQEYRERRKMIVSNALKYRHGEAIPRVDYTDTERETWQTVYEKIFQLIPTHAVREYQYIFPMLQSECGYAADNIPQLEDISSFLRSRTGFRLRPVMGLLSSRDFLNALAYRVFFSTQYIRHASRPLYTPEPDVCHELIGHVPLFADPDFANFSQEIGMASIGASDRDVKRLATCYWYTVEFGLCRQGGQLRAYGAGLLSSFGELDYCVGNGEEKPAYKEFNPFTACDEPYPITRYQPTYHVSNSFAEATLKMREFASTLERPFRPSYNAYTERISPVYDL